MGGSKRWCFTIQVRDGDDALASAPAYTDEMAYLIYGKEVAPTTGQIHLQGYVRFTKRKELKTAKKCLPDGAHLEIAKGNEKQNREYCIKEGEFLEFGSYDEKEGQQGRRSDLEEVAEKIKAGSSLKAIAEENPATFIKNSAGIEKLARLVQPPPPPTRDVQTIILWGPTGTGKTHRVRTTFPEAYSVIPGRDPWGDYCMEKVIFFDEFDWQQWSIQEMNMFLDKWPCKLNARYNNKNAYWEKIYICANDHPDNWWPSVNPRLKGAFERRITDCVYVDSVDRAVNLTSSPQPSPQQQPPRAPSPTQQQPSSPPRKQLRRTDPQSPSLSDFEGI